MAISFERSTVTFARCPAAGSLTIALNRAVDIAFEEFRIPGDVLQISKDLPDCSAIRGAWEGVKVSLLKRASRLGSRRNRRLDSTLKSCSRLFDASCVRCDDVNGNKARQEWDRRVGETVDPAAEEKCRAWVPALQERVRILVAGWGEGMRRERGGEVPFFGEYVPDQQGCYETRAKDGGTLATGPADYSGDWSLVRRGVAKTKGKHRVVTMQSAEVKRTLAPVHNALYDHISSKGWCVRGDVLREDFAAIVADRRDGESYISGDYEQATNYIYLPAVEAIVGVIAESPELTEFERKVLVGSFSNLRWANPFTTGIQHPIRRGSMMGNLVSFPLLCLLNKACFDIACDIREAPSLPLEVRGVRRVGRFNGDDCCFCGDSEFFETWKSVTSIFGLVVNTKKTGFSRRWLELNSSNYDSNRGNMVAKPVLSFLRPARSAPGSILPSVLQGISSFRFSVQQRIVKVLMRYEICLRGVRSSLGCLSRRWTAELLKLRWFRAAVLDDPAPVKEEGVDRSVPVTVGPVPKDMWLDFVTSRSAEFQHDYVRSWWGVPVVKHTCVLDRKAYRARRRFVSPRLRSLFEPRGKRWRFVWPTPLLSLFRERWPWALQTKSEQKWTVDHPFLTTQRLFTETPRGSNLFPPPPAVAAPAFTLTEYPLGYW